MSVEEVVLTPASEGMRGAIERAMEMTRDNPDCFLPQQFANQANPQIHRDTTAREILAQMPEGVAAVVAGVGAAGDALPSVQPEGGAV